MGVVLYKGDNTLMEQKSKDVIEITHKNLCVKLGSSSGTTCA